MNNYKLWRAWYDSSFGNRSQQCSLFRNFLAKVDLTLSTTGKTALDAGCGTGLASYILSQSGWHVTGIDLSQTMLDKAIANYTSETDNVAFRQADLAELPSDLTDFDAVVWRCHVVED